MSEKAYIINGAKITRRGKSLIKYLLDNDFQVYLNNYNPTLFHGADGVIKIFRILIRILDELIKKPFQLYNILQADIVILPEMSNEHQFELKAASLLNKYIITDFYISIYDTNVRDRGIIKADTFQARQLKKKDQIIINLADKVLFLNKTEREYYLKLLGIEFDSNKHKTLPLIVEDMSECKLNYYKESESNKVFNVCWWGTYIPLHGLENIILAAKYLRDDYDLKFHFHLFGNSERKSKQYEAIIEKENLNEFVTIKNDYSFSNGLLEDFLVNNCDLALGNFGDTEKSKNVLVNKVLEGVALRTPVLTGESKAPKEFFSRQTLFYAKNNPKNIAEHIFDISERSNRDIHERVDRAYSILVKRFSQQAFKKNLSETVIKVGEN